jgi:hypothetical protein
MSLLKFFQRESKKSDKNGDTGKPNILITLPTYFLMTGEEPFADMATDYNDPKLDLLSVYTALHKVFCYNKLLLAKFEKDIYYSTILEKQREKIAANSLEISEQFSLLMRMFHELDELNAKESNSDLENLIAFALINKEKEFSDVKDEENARIEWMMKIANIFKINRCSIEKYFQNCWKNSGFNKSELEAWLTKS